MELLQTSDVAHTVNEVVELGLSRGDTRVTWAGGDQFSGELFRNDSGSIDEYCDWVRANAYSAALFDGSLLQLTFDFSHNRLMGHRLCFIPCPFNLDQKLLQETSLLEVVDLYRDNGYEDLRLVSPMRFDYGRTFDPDTHPRSHFTFQSHNCRIPVSTPVLLGNFIEFVFRFFYPIYWMLHSFIREWPTKDGSTLLSDVEFAGWFLSVPRKSLRHL
ncbi:MAG: DUF2290 domain-containing protein [Chloroflexota bacterium]|nr:DUF2290 domain-containing protein [Chloroflexota bacterium]